MISIYKDVSLNKKFHKIHYYDTLKKMKNTK
jgi:hypothetical protein